MLGGTGTVDRSVVGTHRPSRSASDPSSISIEISSSTNSGFPSAASAIRRSTSGSRDARPSNCSISLAASASVSGSRWIVVALSLPPPHIGRRSSSSARARHSRRIGASRDQSAMCSMRSRNVGSAQWMSSKTTTQRCVSSDLLEQPPDRPQGLLGGADRLRQPDRLRHAVDDPSCVLVILEQRRELEPHGLRCVVVETPAAARIASATGRKVTPSPYGAQWPRTTVARSAAEVMNSSTSRDLPTPAVPRTVNRWHARSVTAASNVWSSIMSGRSRPTSGACSLRGVATASGRTLTRRIALIGPTSL